MTEDTPSFSSDLVLRPPLPSTCREAARHLALRAGACVGAEFSNLGLIVGSKWLRLFHGPFLDAEMADRYAEVPLDAPYPITAAIRKGEPVLLPDLDAYREQYQEILEDTIAAGVQATASLPLYRKDGSALGAVGFAWTTPTAFDPQLRHELAAMAQLCVETVERAERHDAEHELISALHARLLGDLPAFPSISAAARYLPASAVLAVGGDWYEALVLDSARIAFVVGDVTGHGVSAAADMALIRGTISALLLGGLAPTEVFAAVSGVLAQRKELTLATAAVAIVDTEQQRLTYATAGHPPALVRLPTGDVRTLTAASGPVLGIAPRSGIEQTESFPVGSTLVMFTDGLVERRDRPFDVGIDALADHLSTATPNGEPDKVLGSILECLLQNRQAADDVAVVVVEHSG